MKLYSGNVASKENITYMSGKNIKILRCNEMISVVNNEFGKIFYCSYSTLSNSRIFC
jgi:hypothetical protein